MNVKSKLRSGALTVLDAVGVNRVLRSMHSREVRIFALHGVADFSAPSKWKPLRPQMDVNVFRNCMKMLTKQFRFVSMSRAIELLAADRPVPRNIAVVTFDDGYQNNFSQALPVLREFNVPAVFYVATDHIEYRLPFWFDRLDFAIQAAARRGLTINFMDRKYEMKAANRERLKAYYAEMRARAKIGIRNESEFVRTLDHLASDLEESTGESLASHLDNDPWAGIVSIATLKTATADKLVEIGSHTCSHQRLSCAVHDERVRELEESKRKIEDWTNAECRHFAYPNGEFDSESCELVARTGYKSGVTTVHGTNAAGSDAFRLKRLNVPYNKSLAEYSARASGLDVLPGRLLKRERAGGDARQRT